MDDFELLKKVPIFEELSDGQLKDVFGIISRKRFEKDEMIIQEGDTGDTMYILSEGAVEISKTLTLKLSQDEYGQREKSLTHLEGKDHPFFGEMSMLEDAERSATVTAIEDSTVLVINREQFDGLCKRNPVAGYIVVKNIAKVLSARMRSTNRDMLKLATALSLALSK